MENGKIDPKQIKWSKEKDVVLRVNWNIDKFNLIKGRVWWKMIMLCDFGSRVWFSQFLFLGASFTEIWVSRRFYLALWVNVWYTGVVHWPSQVGWLVLTTKKRNCCGFYLKNLFEKQNPEANSYNIMLIVGAISFCTTPYL